MKKVIALLLVICQLSIVTMSAAVKVHTIGDSTMSDYNPSATDKRGWGTYLGLFFDSNFVTVNNRGKSGASTRTFYDGAAFWPSVKSQMSKGDYLIIQFAHNDEKSNGLDVLEYNAYLRAKGLPEVTDLRGTCPNTTYKDNLRRYIDEARALGVTPILFAPISRKYFANDSTIRRNGQHDLGDKFSKIENGVLYENQSVPATDHSMDYVYQMRQVASEKNVPFIDMTSLTRDLYLHYGDAYCTAKLFCQGDKTHTAEPGAILIARLAAQQLKEAGILAEYIVIPDELPTPAANPVSASSTLPAKGYELPASMTLHNMRAVDRRAEFKNAQGKTVSMQRFHNSDDGKAKTPWPADEIDENAVRYIDLAVSAPGDSVLRITAITMELSASGTSTMSCHINTGFGEQFTDVHTFYEKVALPRQVVTPVVVTPSHLTIPTGKTMHIRLLPWLNGETTARTNKYICVGNIRIEGYSEKAK